MEKDKDVLDKKLMDKLFEIKNSLQATLRLGEYMDFNKKKNLEDRLDNVDKMLGIIINKRIDNLNDKKTDGKE